MRRPVRPARRRLVGDWIMTWMLWRQHRAACLAVLVILAAVSAFVLPSAVHLHTLYDQLGLSACGHSGQPGRGCDANVPTFSAAVDASIGQHVITWLNLLPAAFGAFLGAPMLAREIEQATYRLAWTQGVSRRRWLAGKITALGALSVLAGLGLGLVITWYRDPLNHLSGRYDTASFDFTPLVVPAYTLFAFALASCAGALLRRTVPAIAVGLIGYFAVRIPVETLLRPHYLPPAQALWDPASAQHPNAAIDWVFGNGYADAAGRHLSHAQQDAVLANAGGKGGLTTYLHQHGYQRWASYQPANRFWSFQLIEAGLFTGLALLLIAVIVWRVRRGAH